jgi:heavy metal sensor kinase
LSVRQMTRLPIRIRLTLWYFAMFASAATLLCVASLWMLERSVDQSEYHDLQERAEDVQLVLSHADAGRTPLQLAADLAEIYEVKDDGKYLQVLDDQGNWIFRSGRMVAQNPGLGTPGSLSAAGTVAQFHQGTRYVKTLAYPIVAHGKRYSVQTGMALNKSMVLVSSFRDNLLLLAPIVILLAAVGGHVMSRKALRPVTELASQARRINDRNLDIRVPVPRAKDEISDLSRTLNQMLERIDKAFATVRTFTGNASHELRTPISLLRTEIEVALLRPRKNEEYRAILERLHEETIRMTTLVEGLLALARADGGAETIALAPIRVSNLFHRINEIWTSGMTQAMLDFRLEAPSQDITLLADADGAVRLLSILLENAIKYTPPGGTVKVCAEVEQERAILSVLDTGIGIAPEHLALIFDRFYRASPRSEAIPQGSGLGLSLARWIAERHGTELCVESTPGSGSRFSFSLQRTPIALPFIEPRDAIHAESRKDGKPPSSLAL